MLSIVILYIFGGLSESAKHSENKPPLVKIFALKSLQIFLFRLQLDKYETAPHFVQLTQNLTSDCWFI